MTAVTELDLPRFEYLDPDLRGDRFHETMQRLREQSWLASSEFGYFVLDREAAGFILRSRSATFPGIQMFELLGIDEGPLRESLSSNILVLNGDQHTRLRKLAHGNDKRAIDEVTSFGCR